jgi:hypothetical protein
MESFLISDDATGFVAQCDSKLSTERSTKFATHPAALRESHNTAWRFTFRATMESSNWSTYCAAFTMSCQQSKSTAISTPDFSTYLSTNKVSISPT